MNVIEEKFLQIKLLALDSDGVLTDGGVYMSEAGDEFRRFDIKDGQGLVRLQEEGITIAIISASSNGAIKHRAKKLGITHVYTGVKNKFQKLVRLCKDMNLCLDEVCFIGDDISDIATMQNVGLSCAPANAVKEILEFTDYVCAHKGGFGAVREVCDKILGWKQIP